jgi:hypothetical protein
MTPLNPFPREGDADFERHIPQGQGRPVVENEGSLLPRTPFGRPGLYHSRPQGLQRQDRSRVLVLEPGGRPY